MPIYLKKLEQAGAFMGKNEKGNSFEV